MARYAPDDPPQLRPERTLIFIHTEALAKIQGHLHTDIKIELGGLLTGIVYYDPRL